MTEISTEGPYSISSRPLNSLELAFTNWQLEEALDSVNELYPLLALMQSQSKKTITLPDNAALPDNTALKDL